MSDLSATVRFQKGCYSHQNTSCAQKSFRMIGEQRKKLDDMHRTLLQQRQSISDQQSRIRAFLSELSESVHNIQNPARLKEAIRSLYKKHCPNAITSEEIDNEIESEYNRQKEYLEKSVSVGGAWW